MNLVQDMDINHQVVILRCDLNVTIKSGKIMSNERIKASLTTIEYLAQKQAKVIVMSHLGNVKNSEDQENLSLKTVYDELVTLTKTPIYFCPQTHGPLLEEAINNIAFGTVLLMENTRFEDLDKQKESNNDDSLAAYWASLGDIFIYDAFGVSHRVHASTSGIAKYLPSGIGFLMQKELNGLAPLMDPVHPFVVVMGGAKVTDKIELIKSILKKCDYLLVGGGIANTFLAINHEVGSSLVSEEAYEEVRSLLKDYQQKIILPVDVVVSDSIKNLMQINETDVIYDLGPQTLENYITYLKRAKLIFVTGTVGMYENASYANGTKVILEACADAGEKVIVGGGDALASVEHFGIKNLSFISTGGGATLDYIGQAKIKCLESFNN